MSFSVYKIAKGTTSELFHTIYAALYTSSVLISLLTELKRLCAFIYIVYMKHPHL